jgi:hypothetical protein
MAYDVSRYVQNLRNLAHAQRQLNDQQIKARREAWDEHLQNITTQEEVSYCLRELAANPVAW